MPLERYTHGSPHYDAGTEGAIRFPMTDGQRVIACEITAEVLRDTFGEDGSDPLDEFLRHRAAIEAAASRAFDVGSFPNDLMELTTADFRGARPS
ncbi:DUF1488 family protein [Methylobacterium dankookense]|uniref:DUF1488 domain-containing protein n=1 Tax=Methylobacterium dankookense TaxID=560405 RepID=A0A564G5S8_9HYPH|nr:DUF1488 family protein [Methylobacterium dankookense]GJD59505.1 hypothetical protein IFDJLNFL_5433 [Methylobacterium dankookense]VUF15903.1 hypothetical protein MTDSW087_05651 [Methylobacterium dankookense]